MQKSSPTSKQIVIDANIAVHAVLPIKSIMNIIDELQIYRQNGIRLIAPDLMISEAASVIRRLVFMQNISFDECRTAIDDLFALNIRFIPLDIHLCHLAFQWAAKHQHAKIYDSIYLALADNYKCSLWSADKRLVNGSRQLGFTQIFNIEERIPY